MTVKASARGGVRTGESAGNQGRNMQERFVDRTPDQHVIADNHLVDMQGQPTTDGLSRNGPIGNSDSRKRGG